MLEVATGAAGLRRNMCGLYALEINLKVYCRANYSTDTYSYFHRVFMSNEANFRSPAVASNNSGDEYKSLVIGGI